MSEEQQQPEDIREQRSLVTDIALFTGPAVGAATGWALSQ
jgi:hypothetical protein